MNTSYHSSLYGINLLSILNLQLPSMMTSPSSWVASQNPFADASSAMALFTIQHVNICNHVPITLDYDDSTFSPPDCLLRHHILQVRTARPCQRLRRCAEHVAQCPVAATDRPVPLFLRPFGAPFAAYSSTTQINALSMLSRNSTVLSGSSTPGKVGHRL
jgi:hypothetical protein